MFQQLESGTQVDGRVVATLPITDEVIQRVEELGQQQNQPLGNQGCSTTNGDQVSH